MPSMRGPAGALLGAADRPRTTAKTTAELLRANGAALPLCKCDEWRDTFTPSTTDHPLGCRKRTQAGLAAHQVACFPLNRTNQCSAGLARCAQLPVSVEDLATVEDVEALGGPIASRTCDAPGPAGSPHLGLPLVAGPTTLLPLRRPRPPPSSYCSPPS